MTKFKRKAPQSLRYLQALLPRISPKHQHYDDLQIESAIRQKGFNGEKKLDYHLQMLGDDYKILSDITLSYKNATFQIDSLILSRHAIFIIDSKSIDGLITFNTNLQQLTQQHQGVEKGFKYPITQLESIKFLFMKWLEDRDLTGFPIFYFVSLSDTSSILRVVGDENYIRKLVTYAEGIPNYIMSKNEQITNTSPANKILKEKIRATIWREKQDLFINLAQKYKIERQQIAPGVLCGKCYQLQTVFIHGYWSCKKCGHKCKEAYRRAFLDYFLLFVNGISNKETRWFLGVNNRSTATRILQRSKLRYNPKNKKWYQ